MSDLTSLNLSSMGPLVAASSVFIGGVLSAFNPCCFPMIPTIVALLSNHSKAHKLKAGFIAALFVFGFAVATGLMGAASVGLGIVFGRLGKSFNYVVALIPIVMAFQLLGLIRFRLPMKNTQNKTHEGFLGAIVTGFTFALVIVPCATPIFASVLAYAAYSKSVVYGSFLLFLYGVGVGVPLVIMGSFMGLMGVFKYVQIHKTIINNLTVVALVAIGLYLIWRA